jgi:lipopolysaccharide transport system ATP-binding protein
VKEGEVFGFLGANGAGKSTLLKILTRVMYPHTGRVDVYGRVGALIEVRAGIHPDLTGRENIFLNGAILGMTKAEIARKFDEIVAFAEIDRFIDTPVKHYSSGMYMRLAFAVAAHLETEILVVDEVLAVGDVHFQKKCLGKMDDIARHGRTVLFISHNMEAIQRLCTRGLLMDRGRLTMSGPIAEVVAQYRTVEQSMIEVGRFNPRSRSGTGWARVSDIRLEDDRGQAVQGVPPENDLVFQLDLQLAHASSRGASLRGLVVELVICSDQGQPLLSLMNVDDGGVELPSATSCTVSSSCDVGGPPSRAGLRRSVTAASGSAGSLVDMQPSHRWCGGTAFRTSPDTAIVRRGLRSHAAHLRRFRVVRRGLSASLAWAFD